MMECGTGDGGEAAEETWLREEKKQRKRKKEIMTRVVGGIGLPQSDPHTRTPDHTHTHTLLHTHSFTHTHNLLHTRPPKGLIF